MGPLVRGRVGRYCAQGSGDRQHGERQVHQEYRPPAQGGGQHPADGGPECPGDSGRAPHQPQRPASFAVREGTPRADRAWPLAWPSPSGPLGWQRLRGQA
jgi:hypothetical protein